MNHRYEIPLDLTPAAEAALAADVTRARVILGDLQDRLYRHINRLNTGASVGVDHEKRVVVLVTEVERKPGKVERIVANWKEYHAYVFVPKPAPTPKRPGLTVAQRVVEANANVQALLGTPGAATHAELVDVLRELAAAAAEEVRLTQNNRLFRRTSWPTRST